MTLGLIPRLAPTDVPEDYTPEVFFLPLAVPRTAPFRRLAAARPGCGLSQPAVLARRIPDLLHQLFNRGGLGPAAMLEVQTPVEDETDRAMPAAETLPTAVWADFQSPPGAAEAFHLLPDGEGAASVVTGVLELVSRREGIEGPAEPTDGADSGARKRWSQKSDERDVLRVELHVYQDSEIETGVSTRIEGALDLDRPVAGLLQLASRLASVLDLPFEPPDRGLMTDNGKAFFAYLAGLEGASLLSGDLAIPVPSDAFALVQPFVTALTLDPKFGLALRTAQAAVQVAFDERLLRRAECMRVLDACFAQGPADGEACVAVADQLSVLGDERRARQWLEYATKLEPPPARGLENLGILLANLGQTEAARELWKRGLSTDGHPDFHAHLARLAFDEKATNDGWRLILAGLHRLHERLARAVEWVDDGRGSGVLLRYLSEHLAAGDVPSTIPGALRILRGLPLDREDAVHLGLCFAALDRKKTARALLVEGLRADVSGTVRDRGVRALLELGVEDFEKRFAKAVEMATSGRNPRSALPEFQAFLETRPDFWPAVFFSAVAWRRLEDEGYALDLCAEVLRLRPGQPDALFEMAQLFDARGNPKRALECVEEALIARPSDVSFRVGRARYLFHLDQVDEARIVLDSVAADSPDAEAVLKLQREMK